MVSCIQNEHVYINTMDETAVEALGIEFCRLVSENKPDGREMVILCIGTDRATGDSLGPLTGSWLAENAFGNVKLFGTLENPVHARNIEETLKNIYLLSDNPFIVAVDASLGSTDRIGFVKLGPGPIRPGLSLNKKLPPVGDIHLTGVVNFCGMMEMLILQTTKLSIVMKMSDVLSKGINIGLMRM